MSTVQVNNISKSYDGGLTNAVDDVSFEVHPGEIFGLIGPDGAGKTTLLRILTTLLLADSGEAWIESQDVVKDFREIRLSIGYMPGKFSLYQDLTVEENLNFFASVFKTSLSENRDLIHDIYIQLEPFKNRRAGKLSGGMKQKLALCCALIHRPTVLFLDEPTTGVDTVSRKEFWEMLRRLKAKGITILVSTPYMDEASMCDRIALIQKGKILSIDTPDAMIDQFPSTLYRINGSPMYQLLNTLRNAEEVQEAYAFGEYHHLILKPNADSAAFQKKLDQTGIQNLEMSMTRPTIEDCFIQYLNEHE